ncbi:MAG TPA: hypothetical protein VFH59_06275 [Frateuria sp.]|uniref:hypothetical protein n=1 Tax=Frateuria sp. TaxID=2211372 RepID=UPI002D7FD588|nr:hypothetical protein [Frateuria sp.]HET6805037.1 hypothetical protein [Frateuria sp.]
MTPLVIGVTSHRDLPPDDTDAVRRVVRRLFEDLRQAWPSLPLVVLSALAEGGDQLVAEEALAQGVRLIAPLPLPRALYEEDFTDPAARTRFEALCARADVMVLPVRKGRSHREVGNPGTARDQQYAQAGVYIASHCHILLAIWDGQPSDRLGGTAQIVRYHLRGILPGPPSEERDPHHILAAGDERLLYHVLCGRADTPADARPAVTAMWRHAAAATPEERLPAAFRLMFDRMAEFNDECVAHAAAIEATTTPAAAGTPVAPATARMGIECTFREADWLAMHFQHRVLLAMRTIYTLAALMGIAFTCYAHFAAQNYLIYLFLLLFALGTTMTAIAKRRGWHRKYLDYRALAEGLRIQSYWRRAGISLTRDHAFAHDDFLQRQNVELGWIRNVMRASGLPPSHPPTATAMELAGVIAEWVGEPGRSGQLYYYERKSIECAGLHRVTEALGALSLWGGVSISVLLALFALRLEDATKATLVAVMGILSIIAAVREAYAYRKADKVLLKQYRFMERILGTARAALDQTDDPAEQRAILRALGHAALTEHAEWTLMQRERQVEHGPM